jgi:hypothetical protein
MANRCLKGWLPRRYFSATSLSKGSKSRNLSGVKSDLTCREPLSGCGTGHGRRVLGAGER